MRQSQEIQARWRLVRACALDIHPILFQNWPKTLAKDSKKQKRYIHICSWGRRGPSCRYQRPEKESKAKPDLGAQFWEGSGATLALCWAKLRSKSTWKPYLVTL